MKEWQCTCGAWIPAVMGRHTHMRQKSAGLGDLMAHRAAMEAGLTGIMPDPLDSETEIINVWWSADRPTRDTPP